MAEDNQSSYYEPSEADIAEAEEALKRYYRGIEQQNRPSVTSERALPHTLLTDQNVEAVISSDRRFTMPLPERLALKASELEAELNKEKKITGDPRIKKIIAIRRALESRNQTQIGEQASKVWPDEFTVEAFNKLHTEIRKEAEVLKQEKGNVEELRKQLLRDKNSEAELKRAELRLAASRKRYSALYKRLSYFGYNTLLIAPLHALQVLNSCL